MDGFAASYAATLAARGVRDPDAGIVMGYFNAADLPVYDHLAEHFCVCDRWHSSVPGATWPNRLYAVAGGADGSRDDPQAGAALRQALVRPPPRRGRRAVALVLIRHRHAALRRRRIPARPSRALRVRPELRLSVEAQAEELAFVDETGASFLEDAARGRLPAVSWIDPNFKDLNLVGSAPNDDHPPSDVAQGQELVLLVYNALAGGPLWERTLLVVLYDEHGGFFDHVPPPPAPATTIRRCSRYGVRVPALVVSPWVPPRTVSHTLYDHTTIIKTILRRFCPGELTARSPAGALVHWLEPGHPHYMGARVAAAADLGELLSLAEPRPAPVRAPLVDWLSERHGAHVRRLLEDPQGMLRPAEAHAVTDLQAGMLAAAAELHARGHPPDQP